MLEVLKDPRSKWETHIRVVGRIIGNDVVGGIILRVAVGCDDRTGDTRCSSPANDRDHRQTLFDRLSGLNSLVAYDKDDPGAGYYYAELTFDGTCPIKD